MVRAHRSCENRDALFDARSGDRSRSLLPELVRRRHQAHAGCPEDAGRRVYRRPDRQDVRGAGQRRRISTRSASTPARRPSLLASRLASCEARCRAPHRGPHCGQHALELFLGNAGTAMRPLCAALCLGSGSYVLGGEPRMEERPIGDLVDALRQVQKPAYRRQ